MAPFRFLRELQPHSKSLIFHWISEHEKYKQNQAILKCPNCMMCLQNILRSFHCIQNCFLTYFRSMFEYFSIIFIPHNIMKHSMEVQIRSAYSVKVEKMNIFMLKYSTNPLPLSNANYDSDRCGTAVGVWP